MKTEIRVKTEPGLKNTLGSTQSKPLFVFSSSEDSDSSNSSDENNNNKQEIYRNKKRSEHQDDDDNCSNGNSNEKESDSEGPEENENVTSRDSHHRQHQNVKDTLLEEEFLGHNFDSIFCEDNMSHYEFNDQNEKMPHDKNYKKKKEKKQPTDKEKQADSPRKTDRSVKGKQKKI